MLCSFSPLLPTVVESKLVDSFVNCETIFQQDFFVRVLVGVVDESAAPPANCSFIHTTRITACSCDGTNAKLSSLKGTDVLILLALNTNRVVRYIGFLSKQERLDDMQELVSIDRTSMDIDIYCYDSVYGSRRIRVKPFCLVSIYCGPYFVWVFGILKAVYAADGSARTQRYDYFCVFSNLFEPVFIC